MTTNTTTRRALLRAATTATAYAAGAAIVAGGALVVTEARAAETQTSAVDRTKWDRAFAAHRSSLDAVRRHPHDDAYTDAENLAWGALIVLAAPDATALMWKMDYLFDQPDGEFCDGWSMDIINVLKADVRHLAKRGA